MFENFVLVFSNPIILFLVEMFLGTVVVNKLFKFLFKRGTVSSFSVLGFVAQWSSGMILIFALLYAFSNPQTVLAEEPPVVVAVESQPIAEPATCIFQYPENIQPWCLLIEEAALKYDVDPFLIAAVITQESDGNPDAYSSSGAVGLMQVMPSDGIAADFMCINGPCFANRPSSKELDPPPFNVDYGSGMLSGLIAKYGNTREALVAYGPMDVGYYYADLVLGIYEDIKP